MAHCELELKSLNKMIILKVLLHNVWDKFSAKLPEFIGIISSTLGIMLGMDLITMINGFLQTLVLIASIAVSIITYLYIRDKRNKIKKED
jgi:peptidoglycan biosynthesis protein MviN/MurJ (putative lipid II flippase)